MKSSMHTARYSYVGAEVYFHSFLIGNYIEMSGHIHTPVKHDRRKALCIHGIGGWVGLRAGTNASEKIYFAFFWNRTPYFLAHSLD